MKIQTLLLSAALTALVMGSVVYSAISLGGFGRQVADAQPLAMDSQGQALASSAPPTSGQAENIGTQSQDPIAPAQDGTQSASGPDVIVTDPQVQLDQESVSNAVLVTTSQDDDYTEYDSEDSEDESTEDQPVATDNTNGGTVSTSTPYQDDDHEFWGFGRESREHDRD